MPICRSCLKGFNSDLNICPHCEHDQSKKSFRSLLTLIFIIGLGLFLYVKFFSKHTVTILYDGKPKEGHTVSQFMKRPKVTNKYGNVYYRSGYCSIEIDNNPLLKWSFPLENDVTLNISTKKKILEIKSTKYGIFEEVSTIPFTTLKAINTPPTPVNQPQ